MNESYIASISKSNFSNILKACKQFSERVNVVKDGTKEPCLEFVHCKAWEHYKSSKTYEVIWKDEKDGKLYENYLFIMCKSPIIVTIEKVEKNVKKRLASYCQCKYHTTPKWKIKKRLKLDKMKEHNDIFSFGYCLTIHK